MSENLPSNPEESKDPNSLERAYIVERPEPSGASGGDMKLNKELIEKRNTIEDLDEAIKEARERGDKEQERVFLESKEKASEQLKILCEEITGENVNDNINEELRKKGLKRVSRKERARIEAKVIEREIRGGDYKKAKEILLEKLPKKIKESFENDDDAFKNYLKEQYNPNEINDDTYFRLIANGVRVDLTKKEKTFARVWRGTKGIARAVAGGGALGILGAFAGPAGIILGVGAGGAHGAVKFAKAVANNEIRVPLENGESICFDSEDEFVAWAGEQEKKTKEDIKDEAGKRVNVKLKNADGGKRETEDIKKEIIEEQNTKARIDLFKDFVLGGGNQEGEEFENNVKKQRELLGLSEDDYYAVAGAGYRVKKNWYGRKKILFDGQNLANYNKGDFEKIVEQTKTKTQGNIDVEADKREKLIARVESGKKILQETKEKCQNDLLEKAVGKEGVKETSERSHKKLDREFEQFKKDIPPIGKESFDTKENLDYIRKLKEEAIRRDEENVGRGLEGKKSKKEQNQPIKKLVRTLGENTLKQQEAWALCSNFIEREIENNPDIPKDGFDDWKKNLIGWVEKFGQNYGFTDEQKEKAGKIINLYKDRRNNAKAITEQLKDKNGELIEAMGVKGKLTEEEIKGIKVSVDKMSVVIEANKEIVNKLWTKDAETITSGVEGFFCARNGVSYVVINGESSSVEKVKKHEIQHAKNAIFGRMFRKLGTGTEKEKYESAKNSKMDMITAGETDEVNKYEIKEKKFLEEYLRAEQKYALGRVKNEFVASLHTSGLEKLKEKWEEMFLDKTPNNIYDFTKDIRESGEYGLSPDISQKIFGGEYKKIIENAIKAFADLVDKDKAGYSIDKAINFLTNVDLEFWPANIRRLVKNKDAKKKNQNKKQP